MSMRDYWQQQPDEQQAFLKTANLAELEAYAEEHHLLVHGNKLYTPEEYPCECELQDPAQCFEDISFADLTYVWEDEEAILRQCMCPCHHYYEPF